MSAQAFLSSAFLPPAAQRRRLAAIFGAAGSLAFHLLFLLGMGAALPPLAGKQRHERPRQAEERQARKMPFVLVEENRPPQPADPRKAEVFADRSLRAAEEHPDMSLADGAPRRAESGHTLTDRAGRHSLAMSPPTAASPLPPRPPALRMSVLQPEQKPEPAADIRQNGDGPQPIVDPRHAADREKSPATPPSPAFRTIGDAAPPGAKPRRNVATSARLVGSPSFEALRAKWGEYMRQVALQLHQACRRQESLAHRSFRIGVVQMAFGIAADGNVENIRLINADEDLLAERHVARAALEDAGPFPPLTPEMQKDEHFKNIVVNFIFE